MSQIGDAVVFYYLGRDMISKEVMNKLLIFCKNLTKRSTIDADDLFQDTMVKFYSSEYKDSNLLGYLRTIAYRRFIDLIRSNFYFMKYNFLYIDGKEECYPSNQEDNLFCKELDKYLSPIMKQRFIEDKDYENIPTGHHASYAKKAIHHGRKRLKQEIDYEYI